MPGMFIWKLGVSTTLLCKTFQILETLQFSRLNEHNRDFAFFCVWTNETSASRNLRSYLVLQRLCNEAALSPGIDAFLY